jgi:hypothetical protein
MNRRKFLASAACLPLGLAMPNTQSLARREDIVLPISFFARQIQYICDNCEKIDEESFKFKLTSVDTVQLKVCFKNGSTLKDTTECGCVVYEDAEDGIKQIAVAYMKKGILSKAQLFAPFSKLPRDFFGCTSKGHYDSDPGGVRTVYIGDKIASIAIIIKEPTLITSTHYVSEADWE